MLGESLSPTDLYSVSGFLFAAGTEGGRGYSAWSDDRAQTEKEARVLVANTVDEDSSAIALGPGGEWFAAFVVDDAVQVYRSLDHCGGWNAYQQLR